MLESIPKLISEEKNDNITRLPKEEEVRNVIFSLIGNSPVGPDGFTSLFF